LRGWRESEAPSGPWELRVEGESDVDGERLHETEEAAHAQMRSKRRRRSLWSGRGRGRRRMGKV
jgi:hypothetical protein